MSCPTAPGLLPFPCPSLCVYPHPARLPPCPVSFADKPVVPLWLAFAALFSTPWCDSSLLEFPMESCAPSSSPITVCNEHVCSFHLQLVSRIHVEAEPHACFCRLSLLLKAGHVYQGAPTLPPAGTGGEHSGLCGPFNPASYCCHSFPVSAPKQCQTRVSQPQEDRSWLCILRRNWQNKPLILSSRLCESLCGEDKGRGTGWNECQVLGTCVNTYNPLHNFILHTGFQ